jgi:hypothetical protein
MVADAWGDTWTMSNISVERFDDFTGGLNLRADQFQLARNESPDMLNVEIDPRGGIFSRGAIREINPTPVIPSGTWLPQKLFAFQGDTPKLMLTTTTRVYHSTGSDFTVLEYSAGNPVTPVQTHGACFAQWSNILYMVIGTAGNGGYSWSSGDAYATALTASGTAPHAWQAAPAPLEHKMPTAEHILVHANRMFVANTHEDGVAHPNRVRWSIEGIPDNWIETDYIDFEGGGKGITGIATVQGQLVVFKPNAIYVVYGYDSEDHQVVQLSAKLGCMSHDHMATSETGIYFYAHPQGLFYYNGSQIVDLFENLKSIYPLNYINSSADDKISVSYVNRRVWVSLPYSKTSSLNYPSISFIYDPSISQGSYVAHQMADGYAPIGGTDFTQSDGVTRFYMIHPNNPRVVQVDMYSNETDFLNQTEVGFSSYYRTGWIDGRSYSAKKMFRRPDFIMKQVDSARNVNVKVFHDYEEADGNERKEFNVALGASATGMLWGSGQWGVDYWGVVAQGAQIMRGSNLGLAKSIQLLFTGPTGKYWGVDSVSYKYNMRKISG